MKVELKIRDDQLNALDNDLRVTSRKNDQLAKELLKQKTFILSQLEEPGSDQDTLDALNKLLSTQLSAKNKQVSRLQKSIGNEVEWLDNVVKQ